MAKTPKVKTMKLPATARRSIDVILSGLIKIEVAPGVFFYTSDPNVKVRFQWDTGSSTGSWTNIT